MDVSRTILVIEDDAMIQDLIHDVLVDEGYRVLRASDGETGLRVAASDQPGLILLDFGLPHMSGAHILAGLKQSQATSRIPVIAVTGQPTALGAGPLPIDGWIAKPFDLEALLAQVERFVDVPDSTAPRMRTADSAQSFAPAGAG